MKRLINIILAVAVAIAAAIVPVGAAFDGQFLEAYPYIMKDNLGFIYLSQVPLFVMPANQKSTSSGTAQYIALYGDTSDLTKRDIIVLYPINNETLPQTEVLKYQAFTVANGISYYLDPNTNVFTQVSNSTVHYVIPNYSISSYSNIFVKMNVPNDYLNYAVTANYRPITEYQVGPSEYMPAYNAIYNVTVDTKMQLIDFITSDYENPEVEKIITELSIAIDQAINQQTSTLINLGNQYIQLLPTTEATQLESIQEQLSSLEADVKNQSKSLQDKVKSEWNNIKSTARQFPNTVAPAATAITTIITDIHEVMPPELQAALLVIPLIIFIGWLIGKIG